ncbi:5-oxoprolinase subunit PxpA [Alphaproteobacteria bacterium]|nr:5-oxoprolinase subunit PxpA [Alphaproteobacteria bacterium]
MVDLNCDMGEGFGIYSFAEDEEIMPFIDAANVACGFHASDPNIMRKTVELAKKYNVKVGAHPSYPDLVGFGRRPMKMQREEIKNLVLYQTGALKAFLDEFKIPLNHIKPHGSLYGVSAKEEDVAHGIADAAEIYNVGIFGMVNTFHEKVYKERGVKFIAEFYSDLEYDETGYLVIAKGRNKHYPADIAVERCLRAIKENKVKTINGNDMNVGCETICVHSDTPNAIEILKELRKNLSDNISKKTDNSSKDNNKLPYIVSE